MTEQTAEVGIRDLAGFLLRAAKDLSEEARAWITARPHPFNRIDEASVNRFFETGPDLIEALVGAIGSGQHVALAGPRGCGKSHCITEAIKLAQLRGLIPTNGFIKIQGNKELPRDYLLEDDMTLSVEDGAVLPKRKDAPLLRFAKRHTDGARKGRPVKDEKGMVECYGVDRDNQIIEAEKLKTSQRVVLFLDEVNRFSDGVLDSLLLLLEEGEAVIGGETFRFPVVVMMTMNPPGYDASARSLSPPLSARIGRQYRLLSPRIDVLTDRIAPDIIDKLQARAEGALGAEMTLQPPSVALVRRAAAATLCSWGDPRMGNPGFDYLSEETKALLIGLADSSTPLKAAMRSLTDLCNFGPDGRALGDWIVAASVTAANEARALRRSTAEPTARHFIACAVTVLSHKLQDNFSSASRPENTRRKEEALFIIASNLMAPSSIEGNISIDNLVMRPVDSELTLSNALMNFPSKFKAGEARAAFISCGITEIDEISRWIEFFSSMNWKIENSPDRVIVKQQFVDKLIECGIVERYGSSISFSSKSNLVMFKWVASKLKRRRDVLIYAVLNDIASNSEHLGEPVERHLQNFAFVRAGVCHHSQGLRGIVRESNLNGIPRNLLIEIFECLNDVWVFAEHESAQKVIDPLWNLIAGPSSTDANRVPKSHQYFAAQFALDVLTRMQTQAGAAYPYDSRNLRGGGMRAARRNLRNRIINEQLQLPPQGGKVASP